MSSERVRHQSLTRYPLLDPLRGVAAVWVLLHHLVYSYDGRAPALLKLGYFGVPMFFVISGYCLAAAGRRAVRTGEPARRFLRRRAVRIFPPFWAAVAVAIGVYAVLPMLGAPLTAYEAYLRTAWRALAPAQWAGVITLGSGFFPTGQLLWHKYAPVSVALWTLGIEVQFYVVVVLAVGAGRWFYAVLAGMTAVSVPFMFSGTAFVSGWFLPFWPFFALGVGLYALFERAWAPTVPRTRAAVLCAGLAVAAWGLAVAPLLPDGGHAMMAGEFAFAVGFAAALASASAFATTPIGGILGYLGRTSYSLYLLHVPLMILVGRLVGKYLAPGSTAFQMAVVAGVCALVYPFYRVVERPCIAASQASRRPPPAEA